MKIFIGCGSNPLINEKFLLETNKVCQMICNLNHTLVFGAYSKGMMGETYNVFTSNNKEVIGMTLPAYHDDLENLKKAKIITLDNSFERLKTIYNESDLFLILPGGTGTIAELFGLMEENKTNELNKKIIVYNYDGFYNELIDYLKKLEKAKMVYTDELNKLLIVNNEEELERVIINERI